MIPPLCRVVQQALATIGSLFSFNNKKYNSIQRFRTVDIPEHFAFVSMSSSDVDNRFGRFFCKCFSFHNLPQAKTVQQALDGVAKTRSYPHRHTSTACVQQCFFTLSSSQQAKEEGIFRAMTVWIFGTE